MNVKDKVIMITGAGGGLGSEMARLLCKNGAKVVILDLDAEKGQATADEINAAAANPWDGISLAKGMAVFDPRADANVDS